ncbi:MAG: sensor histidine kinase [Sphingobacteriaceae bacterium]
MIPQQHFEGDWKYVNLYGLMLGLVIGHSIILFNTLFTGQPIKLQEAELVLWVSAWTLCVLANSMSMSISLPGITKWVYTGPTLSFYIVALGGLAIGMFLGVTSASIIFPWPLIATQRGLLLLSFVVSVVVCAGIQLYEWRAASNKQQSVRQDVEVVKLHWLTKEAKLRAIQTKINPHLLYNALNSIAGLILHDSAKAEDMTVRLAQLYRYGENEDQWITIQEELHIARNYLEIEHIRFGDLFNYEFTCDAELLKVTIPRFLLQPLLENAVKHGLAAAGEVDIAIRVNIRRLGGKIQIDVYDNGATFPKTIRAGYGLRSIYARLNIHYGSDYAVKLVNDPEKCISLLLPLSTVAN